MNRSCLHSVLLAVLAGMGTGAAAQSQVYRCGETREYSDKPCDGARPVDLRGNVIDAGPRGFPALQAVPGGQAVTILPDPRQKAAPAGATSVWDRRDAADAEFRGRTSPPSVQR